VSPPFRAAVLVASKNGESTIGDTVRSAVGQCDVYVVSDGSTDATAQVSRDAGAEVLDLEVNVGKPTAIFKAVYELDLLERYTHLSILDDDTLIEPDFIEQCLLAFERNPENAIVVGKTEANWSDDVKWNPWVAARAYAYWRYQLTIRTGQDVFGALNCISGSNSMYTVQLLRDVLVEKTPYIVDDTFWVLEAQRRELGRVKYVPEAVASVQDPTNQKEWYKQNLRWLWGTMQGVIGHKIGSKRTWFDFWYVTLILDWIVYVLLWPLLLIVIVATSTMSVPVMLGLYALGYFAWITTAAIALRKWRLPLFLPFIIYNDWLYRVNFTHSTIKAFRQPTVESCVWESPTRYKAADRLDNVVPFPREQKVSA
jgi:poly-beta-1,6-N-acetyl-D-glucosamine synthase